MRLHVGVVGVAALGAGWLFKVSIPNFVWQVNSACSACLTIDTSCVQIALPSNKALNAIRGMATPPLPCLFSPLSSRSSLTLCCDVGHKTMAKWQDKSARYNKKRQTMKSPTALRPPKNETQNELRQMKTPL